MGNHPCLPLLSKIVLGLAVVLTAIFVLTHSAPLAIPKFAPPEAAEAADEASPPNSNRAEVFTSTMFDALSNKVGLLTSIVLGLTALVGFTLKDGLGETDGLVFLNSILLSLFIYFLARGLIHSFDVYSVIYVQAEQGRVFAVSLDDVVILAARSVVFASIASIAMVILKLFSKKV